MPHFVSLVVVCGPVRTFTSSTGLITSLFVSMGMEPVNLLAQPQGYRIIHVLSDVWQSIGWGAS